MSDSTGLIVFAVWALFVVVVMFTAGRAKWRRYAQIAQLRPEERILHEEDRVPVRWECWGLSFEYSGGGREYGRRTSTIRITDRRILESHRGVPIGVVNYVNTEEAPRPRWLAWKKCAFFNVGRDAISVGTDRRGRGCLEVVESARWLHGLKIRYYFGDMAAVRRIFGISNTLRDRVA